MTFGPCEFFDVTPYLELSNQLVAADEPYMALKVLDSVPGYYRDHYPKELLHQKNRIKAQLATAAFYVNNKWDMKVVTKEGALACLSGFLRGLLIDQDVREYNKQGIRPHLFDLGPGEYWLPLALEAKGYDFTYDDLGLCGEARENFRRTFPPLERLRAKPNMDQPVIYVACEILEHLDNPDHIRSELERKGLKPSLIHISTPLYTFDGRKERLNWDREGGDLGHIRTYTPNEFSGTIDHMFPEYDWSLIAHQGPIMHMRGIFHEK